MFENDGCDFLMSKHRKAARTTGVVLLLHCSFGAPFCLNPTQISVNWEARSSSGRSWQLNFNGSLLSTFILMGFFAFSSLYQLVYPMLQHYFGGEGIEE